MFKINLGTVSHINDKQEFYKYVIKIISFIRNISIIKYYDISNIILDFSNYKLRLSQFWSYLTCLIKETTYTAREEENKWIEWYLECNMRNSWMERALVEVPKSSVNIRFVTHLLTIPLEVPDGQNDLVFLYT